MDITKLLINFNKYLKGTWKNLLNVDIERGSDDWEDWVELSFKVLVLNKLARDNNISIELDYGIWPRAKVENAIKVKIKKKSEILLKLNDRDNKFIEKVLSDSENIEFIFREFNHPFIKENDISAYNFVLGEIISNNYYPEGTIICTAIENCIFDI